MTNHVNQPMTTQVATLITGASSGIGRSIAVSLSQGHKLILHGRDIVRLNETRLLCRNPDDHFCWPFDLSDVELISSELPAFLKHHHLVVDSFIHSAGILTIAPMRLVGLAAARQMMNVNFHSASEIIRLLLKRALNQQQLRNIVFISSTASKFGAKGFNIYCASKGALDSLMRALAVELGPEVRVNSVLPGGVKTDMTASMFNDDLMAERIYNNSPLGHGLSSDIADAVAFLTSEQARWVTGQQIVVDGGRTANISA